MASVQSQYLKKETFYCFPQFINDIVNEIIKDDSTDDLKYESDEFISSIANDMTIKERHKMASILADDAAEEVINKEVNEVVKNQTDYSENCGYADLQQEMNWFYDGFKTNIIHQLQLYHKNHSMEQISNMKVIDIACGDGNFSRTLSDLFGYKNVYAVDISSAQIQEAVDNTDCEKYNNITHECCDASTFHENPEYKSLKNEFDIAVIPWFFCHAENKQILDKFIKSVNFVLKPNAFIVGATDANININNVTTSIHMDNPNFLIETSLQNPGKEGMFIHFVGKKRYKFVEYLYTSNTYKQLFNDNEFKSFNFLKPSKFIAGGNSSQYEKKLCYECVFSKRCPFGIFTAEKN